MYLEKGAYLTESQMKHIDRDVPEPNRTYAHKYKDYLELNNRRPRTTAKRINELCFILEYLPPDAKLATLEDMERMVKAINTAKRRDIYGNETDVDRQAKIFFGWAGASAIMARYVHLGGRDIDNAVFRANGMELDRNGESLNRNSLTLFELLDGWIEESKGRKVFKFKLEITDQGEHKNADIKIDHNRLIPKEVKIEVWKRDKGRCIVCGTTENLHFDHIIPFSKGGSSLDPRNIQILCAKHNLTKRDKIE